MSIYCNISPMQIKGSQELFDDKIIEKEVLALVSDNIDESGIEEDWKVGDCVSSTTKISL